MNAIWIAILIVLLAGLLWGLGRQLGRGIPNRSKEPGAAGTPRRDTGDGH